MIRPISLELRAAVGPAIGAGVRCETAQAHRRIEPACADVDDGALLLVCQSRMIKRYGKELIGAKRRVVAVRTIEHVEQASAFGIPKFLEADFGPSGTGFIALSSGYVAGRLR